MDRSVLGGNDTPSAKAVRSLPFVASAVATAFIIAGETARSQTVAADAGTPEAEALAHVENARRLGGSDVTTPFDFFCVPGNARPNNPSAPPLKPAKLFDNLYVAGNSETVVHAITTSAGIVLIDSGFADEVETVLVPGLLELGLAPADVKVILLGHGHSNHYGGAAWFQTKYGARVGTTASDWDTIARAAAAARPGEPAPPSRDLVLREGEPIVLGDTSITPVEVPGHTPGSLAFIFPVFDGGTRHVAGLFGGTVLVASYTPLPGLRQYVDSIAHYLDIAQRMRVDVEIQNHPIFDDTPTRLAALAARSPGEPNPFVMGTDRYQRFWGIVSECMQADIIRKSSR
jgi:metallo-beta-lactamase class B